MPELDYIPLVKREETSLASKVKAATLKALKNYDLNVENRKALESHVVRIKEIRAEVQAEQSKEAASEDATIGNRRTVKAKLVQNTSKRVTQNRKTLKITVNNSHHSAVTPNRQHIDIECHEEQPGRKIPRSKDKR